MKNEDREKEGGDGGCSVATEHGGEESEGWRQVADGEC